MVENKITRDDEQVPIVPPLKVLDHKTINKRFGWWSAVVLLESYGRKQVCFYLWQKKPEGGWKRKQKFAVHNQQDWTLIQEAVSSMIGTLTQNYGLISYPKECEIPLNSMAKDCILIMVTCSSHDEARKISERLLAKRLIACVNILPKVESRFWWKGSLDRAEEFLMTMKTVKSNFKNIESEIKRAHSYEVPEIIAVPIVLGSRDYLDWISRTIVQ